MVEEKVGRVFTYFSKVGVAGIEVTDGTLRVGDSIRIKGATTDFSTTVDRVEIDRSPVEEATVGQKVGIKVPEKVRPNDVVYKVTEE